SLEERIEGFLAEAEGAAPATLEDSAVETRSDGSGAFRLPLPRPGFFRLTLRKEGRLSLEVWLHPITGDREMPPLVLPKPRTMAVTVLDPAGAPAVGAWVRVPPHPAVPYGPRLAFPVWAPERLVRADGKGQVRLPRSPGTTAEVQAWAPGFVEATGRTGASVTLRLAVAETVRLELVGEQREALGNTLVLVGESLFPAGRSDAEGRFEVSAKARRPLLLHLIPGDGLPRIERLPAARGDEPLRLTLASPVWLDGRVTNAASGQPLAGALVWTPGRDTRWTSTDRGGAFRLALLAEQTRLRASAEGFFGADLQPKPVNGLFPAASIALHPSAELSGLVQDPEGRPVAGAQVTSAFKSKAGPRLGPDLWREARTERLARSDARGRFLLRELLPETPYLLTTRHPRWAEEQTPVTLPATGDPGVPLRIVLRAGITARGRVEDAEERPVPGAQVRLWPAGDDPRLNLFREPTHRTFTDAEGHFSFHALAEGLYELELVASGHASRRLPGMKVAAPEADWGALQLAAGLRLEGQVQEASGAGIGEVAIWVQTGPEARNLFPYQRLEEAPDATSDPRGGFQVEDLAAGTTMSLRLTREGFAPKTVPGLTLPLDQPLVITLEPASAVRGQVLDGSGNPLPEATIGIEHEPGPQGRGRVLEIQQTAPDGAFEFRGLAAGRFALRALKEGYQTATVAVEVPAGQDVEGVEVLL
ncbi:MAG: carboxypeptidase regulatory-like domain-containing protein, partial [Acidobacteria bacterium]|nr:carboxypeptidase regulatory-like domain-containing protein [Acidobacteriota bacterium]